MTTDIIEINDFIVLIEQSSSSETTIAECFLDDQVIGFTFYGSAEVELTIQVGDKNIIVNNASGLGTSFYGNKNVRFSHKILPNKPLQSVSVFSTLKNIKNLPLAEKEIYLRHLSDLIHPKEDFVTGPGFYLSPDMLNVVHKIFNTEYKGYTRKIFMESQIKELLAHFYSHLENKELQSSIPLEEIEKLFNAKEIIANNLNTPPTLSELSKMIGLNNNKLKKNFKELFGVPVFKYLQNERLTKAYDLLKSKEKNVQEVAWFVGYESLSSFSNAFQKRFGYRPSEVRK